MRVPESLRYTADHEWIAVEGGLATIGITEYAAKALGDIVYVQLPEVGTVVAAGSSCGEVESTKSVSDLFAPVGGEVVEVNATVTDDLAGLGLDPYGTWILRIRFDALDEAHLLDAGQYRQLIEGRSS